MFPAYKNMDPYSQTFPHHIPYPYHYYPNWEAVPPQMRVDSSKPPSFGPWPYNGSTSHPNPTECHGCCNYSYSPGYYSFRPPYPHIQPPPQCYYHGPCPPYPDAYPPYFVPPPHYSFDQARYDYDKGKNHCCGCPNHKCHGGEKTGVKIEEQKPESELKPQDSDSSLIRLPNYPYPVAWVPYDYSKEKETNKNSESQPGIGDGWIPLDVNSFKGLRQGGDNKKGSQNEEKKSQFPWPVIRMPGHDKPEEVVNDLKEIGTSPKISEEMPKVKLIPLKFLESENREEKPGVAEDEPTTRAQRESVSEKEMKIKTIPVKQMEESSENKKQNEKCDEKKSGISGKQKEANGVKKFSDGKQSSTVKSSKLPPVCLRVDPLPRRKNGNGTSRSLSPPSLKEKERIHQDNKGQGSTRRDIKEEISKKEIQVVDVKSSNKVEKQEQSSQDVVPNILIKDAPQKAITEKSNEVYEQRAKEGCGGAEASDSKGAECKNSEDGISDDQKKKIEENRGMDVAEITKMKARKERRNLSESDAAVLIQSAYRGFEVRRWQPLEKLRKMTRIREQVKDIKKQIQSFETSSKGQDMKQKMVISETIMNLLLQLDNIQGLHQSVRDVRKSVARELICLQEKLDSLSSQATVEHESSEIEERTSSKAFDDQAICPGSSATVAEPSSKHVYEQLSDQNCTIDFTSREMQEAETEEKRERLLLTENQELESVRGETAEVLNKEMVSFANEEHKEAPMQGDEQPVSGGVASVESKLLPEEPSLELEESSAPLVSTVKEVLEAPAAAEVEATKLDVEEHLETQRPSCQDFELVKKGICDYGAQPNTQVNQEMEKGSVPSSEGCNLEEATEIKVEEHEAVSDALEFEEPLPEKDESNAEYEAPITRSNVDDGKEEELPILPLAEESDSMEKTAGKVASDTRSVEVPTTSRLTNAVDFMETMPGVGESSSEDKAPVTHVNKAGTKEEPQMLPVEEGNYFAEKASGDAAANTINIEVTCATPVTPGASEESNDAGSMIEKSLGMQATMVGIMSQDQITVQGESPVSDTQNGTNSGAADEVIEHREMPLAPETQLEATMDKDVPSSLEEIHHKESSPMPIVEAATNEGSTPVPEEERIAVAQPKDSIPMAGPVSSMNLSMEEKLVKENEKLREMLEKLLLTGKEYLGVVSDLNGRVEDLEKKLVQKKKKKMVKVRRHKPAKTSCKVAC